MNHNMNVILYLLVYHILNRIIFNFLQVLHLILYLHLLCVFYGGCFVRSCECGHVCNWKLLVCRCSFLAELQSLVLWVCR